MEWKGVLGTLPWGLKDKGESQSSPQGPRNEKDISETPVRFKGWEGILEISIMGSQGQKEVCMSPGEAWEQET